jgi:hypothetical protein
MELALPILTKLLTSFLTVRLIAQLIALATMAFRHKYNNRLPSWLPHIPKDSSDIDK